MKKRIKKALDSFFEKCNREIGPDVVANKADKIDFDLLEVLEKIYASPIQDNSSFAYTQPHLSKNSAKEVLRLQRYDAIMTTLANSDYHSIMAVKASLKSDTSDNFFSNMITIIAIVIGLISTELAILISILLAFKGTLTKNNANSFLSIILFVVVLLVVQIYFIYSHCSKLRRNKFILQVIEDLLETRNIKR